MKNCFFFTIIISIFLSGAQPVEAGSIDLVISGLNGQPLSPAQKTITLNPSDVISIDVIYVSDPTYALFGIYADAYLEGAGSGWFDISQIVWPDDFWEWESTIQINGDGSLTINTVDWDAIHGDNEPVTVLSNILFNYTGAGNIHIALRENPVWPGNTLEVDQDWQEYVIEDYGTGVDILNSEPDTSEDGRLPVQLQITGPDEIWENSSQQYNAIVYYNDGGIVTVTNLSDWRVEPNDVATVNTTGKVTTNTLIYPQEEIILSAVYDENDVTVEAQKDITVFVGVTIPELIERNLNDAKQFKDQARQMLLLAGQRETAVFTILRDMFNARDRSIWSFYGNYNCRRQILIAILQEYVCSKIINASIMKLEQAQNILAADANSISP